MKYRVDVWIPAEADEPEIYTSQEEAMDVAKELEIQNPENIIRVIEVHDTGNESVIHTTGHYWE